HVVDFRVADLAVGTRLADHRLHPHGIVGEGTQLDVHADLHVVAGEDAGLFADGRVGAGGFGEADVRPALADEGLPVDVLAGGVLGGGDEAVGAVGGAVVTLDVVADHAGRRDLRGQGGQRGAHGVEPAPRHAVGTAVVEQGHDLVLQQVVHGLGL